LSDPYARLAEGALADEAPSVRRARWILDATPTSSCFRCSTQPFSRDGATFARRPLPHRKAVRHKLVVCVIFASSICVKSRLSAQFLIF